MSFGLEIYFELLSDGTDIPLSCFWVEMSETNALMDHHICDKEDYWKVTVHKVFNSTKPEVHAWETLRRIFTKDYPNRTMFGWHMAKTESQRIVL